MAIRLAFLFAVITILAGCTSSSVNNTLTPQSLTTPQQTNPQQTAVAQQTNPATPQSANALAPETPSQQTQIAGLTATTISFLPIEGAPVGAVQQLSTSIQQSAAANGLAIRPANDPSPNYRVKGYFSALSDNKGTLLTYIWDVVDASGKRLHRINGQERSAGRSANPWQSISANEMKRVADETTAQLKTWVDNQN